MRNLMRSTENFLTLWNAKSVYSRLFQSHYCGRLLVGLRTCDKV